MHVSLHSLVQIENYISGIERNSMEKALYLRLDGNLCFDSFIVKEQIGELRKEQYERVKIIASLQLESDRKTYVEYLFQTGVEVINSSPWHDLFVTELNVAA